MDEQKQDDKYVAIMIRLAAPELAELDGFIRDSVGVKIPRATALRMLMRLGLDAANVAVTGAK